MIVDKDAPQGSPRWLQLRAGRYNAGDAAAMLGCDPHGRSRTDLLDALVNGFSPEVSPFQQKVYDAGHRREALARPLGERIIGEDLYPVVGSIPWPGLSRPLGASCDGLTIAWDRNWEHKSLNDVLRAALPHSGPTSWERNEAAQLPKGYRVQMEQQCLVSGCEQVLFSATEWDEQGQLVDERHCIYLPDLQLRAEILAGWAQLEVDLATHTPVVHAERPQGEKLDQLPVLHIQVEGRVVTSNLAIWREAALAHIAGINRDLKTDQQFADAKEAVKWCDESEKKLTLLKEQTLAQMIDVNEVVTTLDKIVAGLARTRIDLDNLVKARETAIRQEVAQRGQTAAEAHRKHLNERIGRPLVPALTHPLVVADFAKAIKSKRTVKALNDSVDAELSRVKIALSALADRIENNIKHLASADVVEHLHLFPDQDALVLKEEADFRATCTARIAEAKAAEERRRQQEDEQRRQREAREQAAQAAADAERERQAQLAATAAAAPAGLPPAASPAPTPAPAAVIPIRAGATVPRVHLDPEGEPFTLHVPAPAARGTPTLKLGALTEQLGFGVTVAFLETLGFAAHREGNAALYHPDDLPRICQAISRHCLAVAARHLERAA
jgi:predicted phage-related endonuclease